MTCDALSERDGVRAPDTPGTSAMVWDQDIAVTSESSTVRWATEAVVAWHIARILLSDGDERATVAVPAAAGGGRLLPSPVPLSPQKCHQLEHVAQQ
jgi:hypothetical protein